MRVVAIGSHPDDIELGCAGTLLQHVQQGHQVTMLVMTTGERGPQAMVSRMAEQEEASHRIGAKLAWGGFHDGSISHDRDAISTIERVLVEARADVVYVHAPDDSHQDHVATSKATLSAARKLSRVIYYQSPSTLSFAPSMFVDIADSLHGKIAALDAHRSQVLHCDMVDLEAVEATARHWGFQSRLRYAEAFETARFVWDFQSAGTRDPFSALIPEQVLAGAAADLDLDLTIGDQL